MTSDTFNIWARVQVALKLTGVRLMNETPAGRIRMEGFTFHGLRGVERGEDARGRLRGPSHRGHHRNVTRDDFTTAALQIRSALPGQGRGG